MNYQVDIGLEVHAELLTRSKMFCACPVVDSTTAEPNSAVCPVCAGMPGVLPVLNHKAVEYGLRVALALECTPAATSIFARKNYFYPDLPKGYQISQYEFPLALNGRLVIDTPEGERSIRIRRVHLEEDTGKLTHVAEKAGDYSLVDLNRAGVPLLEIVSEPDMHSAAEAHAYARTLRALLRALGVNSGDMEKGVIRFEANVSMRPAGSETLGTRTEIKNLNSFKAMEHAIAFELVRQKAVLDAGGVVEQETLGWDDTNGKTWSQRSKEEAHDYRYFPEPDLPPLVVDDEWVEEIRAGLPELPRARILRFQEQYQLKREEAALLGLEEETAAWFEALASALGEISPRTGAIWMMGELLGWMNQSGETLEGLKVNPAGLADLLKRLQAGQVNLNTAKQVLGEMLRTGAGAEELIQKGGLAQVSDTDEITRVVKAVLAEFPDEVKKFKAGKESVENWLFGQVMRKAGGKANPGVVREELKRQLLENQP